MARRCSVNYTPPGSHWLLPFWLLLHSHLQLSGWLPQTLSGQFPNHVEAGEWQVKKKKVVKVLSPWRPKRPEISFKTAKFSRNWRTGIGEYRLAALAKWPSRAVESRALPRMGQAGRLGAKPRSRESLRRVAAVRTSPGSWSSSTVSPWLTAWSVVDYRVVGEGREARGPGGRIIARIEPMNSSNQESRGVVMSPENRC